MILPPRRVLAAGVTASLSMFASVAAAQGPPVAAADSGDTAWMLVSTTLVLFMMIPGLSLFYAGLVKARNVLSILVQCYALTCIMSLLWFVCGILSGVLCWLACSKLKARYSYDDALDVFGVHGVGGFTGTILVAVFGSKSFPGGLGDYSVGAQLLTQTLAVIYTAILSGCVSLVILMAIERTIGLRVGAEHESDGLDLSDHGEKAYG